MLKDWMMWGRVGVGIAAEDFWRFKSQGRSIQGSGEGRDLMEEICGQTSFEL